MLIFKRLVWSLWKASRYATIYVEHIFDNSDLQKIVIDKITRPLASDAIFSFTLDFTLSINCYSIPSILTVNPGVTR